jgi:hypothetical protein
MTDINKLQSILSKSKAIMTTSDENYGSPVSKGSRSGTSDRIVEHEEKEMPNITADFIKKNSGSNRQPTKKPTTIQERYPNLKKSKMPQAVLDAMIESPIDIPENPFVGGSFSAEDLPEIMESSHDNSEIIINEDYMPQTSAVSRDDIKNVIREEFGDMVRDIIEEYFDKSLMTEDIHIKVGDTIFSGNLKPLPKKKRKK